jgi:tetratricopeptide (TPR) repeat protein
MNTHLDNSQKSLLTSGQIGQATDSFEQSLKLAFEMHNAGRVEEAETLCRALEQIQPKNSQLLFLLGMVLHKSKQDEEAVKWLTLAAQYQPRAARIFNGLGCAYQGLEDHARAAGAFVRAVELEPEAADTYYNLGKSCYRLEQVEQAAKLFRRAVEINPRDSQSWNNLGKCLKELNRLDESMAAYYRALETKPDYALAHYGRSISLLTAGRLLEGFREYEWRWHSMTPRKFPQPAWQGKYAPDKVLFLHAEQGFGDAIQMVRFIAAARKHVSHIILECRPELKTLFQHSKCADTIIAYGEEIPPFDYVLPLLSLPRVLNITLHTIPNQTPYLQAPAGELPAQPGSLKVGLVWAGNPHHHQDGARSIPLEKFAPILQVPKVAFYSLQKPVPAHDVPYLRSMANIDSRPVLEDFLDTASVVAELDLVITVDTAVAHLAGALGKQAWTLVQHSPDWRWLLNRTDTPWYPTMQLFRQTTRGQWEAPILRTAETLRQLVLSPAISTEIFPASRPEVLMPRLTAAAA